MERRVYGLVAEVVARCIILHEPFGAIFHTLITQNLFHIYAKLGSYIKNLQDTYPQFYKHILNGYFDINVQKLSFTSS